MLKATGSLHIGLALGTHAADFMGMAASGNAIQLVGISIDGIENGKIKEHFALADFTQFMQQFVKNNLNQLTR